MTRGDTREEATMGENRWGMSHQEYTEVTRYTQQDYDQQQAELAALRNIVRRLVAGDYAGVGHSDHLDYVCIYCHVEADTLPAVYDHAPDCPILAGRSALADGGEQEGA